MEIVDVCIDTNSEICYEGSNHPISNVRLYLTDEKEVEGLSYEWNCPKCGEEHRTACDEEVAIELISEWSGQGG